MCFHFVINCKSLSQFEQKRPSVVVNMTRGHTYVAETGYGAVI